MRRSGRRHSGATSAILVAATILALCCAGHCQDAGGEPMTVRTDPLTRYFHLGYDVPADAPAEVAVLCSWSPARQADWRPARVMPLISDTALRLASEEEWKQWSEGRVTERRAAGLQRTVVFNPYPDAQPAGTVDVDFRLEIRSPDGDELATSQLRLQADNSDVCYIEDWSEVVQRDAVASEAEPEGRRWSWRTGQNDDAQVTFGTDLHGRSLGDIPLPQLTYPLDLRGDYAVFVCTKPHWGIGLRFTGDERTDRLGSPNAFQEVFWRWPRMDRQHLVLKQLHAYTGYTGAQLDYVKLVPLTDELVAGLESRFGDERDKLIAGYWEPYSWAFYDNVQETLQHREPLAAFAEAQVDIVDTQIGRFGAKVVYESRRSDQLLHSTIGDPIGRVARPTTDNVGRMQQFTNTLDATLRYTQELGLRAHANFGASNCYPGSPLQGDFSTEHPDWMRGSALRYEVPEVREFVLGLYREALEIGAPGLSLDFCRYPEAIDTAETCTAFMRELRGLADEFSATRGERVPILVRFPAVGVRRCQLFDYKTWAHERLVDYLCPSNIQGRHHHFDIAPYIEAVRGTECRLLPCVDGLSWGLQMPGFYLWRVRRLYQAGVDGLYVYQADSRVLGPPGDRRCMRLLGSSQAVDGWWAEEERTRPQRSKGIYITPHNEIQGYHGWERLRVWLEGLPMGKLELHLDGKLVTACDGPPYLLGTEEYGSDKVIPPGEHTLLIRAEDGDDWLERTFTIRGAG